MVARAHALTEIGVDYAFEAAGKGALVAACVYVGADALGAAARVGAGAGITAGFAVRAGATSDAEDA